MARTCGKTSTYTNGGCRCRKCKEAWAEYKRDYRRRKAVARITHKRRLSG